MTTDRLQPFVPPPPPPPPPPPKPKEPEAKAAPQVEPKPTPQADEASGLVARARANTGDLTAPTSAAAGLPKKGSSPLFPAKPVLPEAKATTGDVKEQLDNATKDNDETDEDLREAADAAKTPEDLAAIMKVAEELDQDREAVLRQTLKARDEGADTPNTTMYNAVADQYDALGRPELAAAVRLAGDPATSKGTRHDLTQALQDGDEITEDLQDAAKNARSAHDVEAVLQAQTALGKGDRQDLLQHVLKGQDEDAERPDTEVFEAVAKEWEALGDNQKAIAARAAGDPGVHKEVRERLVHALQDEKDTAEDIKEAFEIVADIGGSSVADDYKAAFDTGKATIGEQHTMQLDASVQLEGVMGKYEDKKKDVEKLDARLSAMLGRTEGALSPDQQAQLVKDFKADHKEYQELEDARDDVAQVVSDHQEALKAALSSGDALDEVETGRLEKALEASASSDVGNQAVEDIATAMLNNADALPKDRQKLLTDKVLPVVMEKAMQRALLEAKGDAKEAVDKFENTPLGQAVKGLGTGATSVSSLKQFSVGYQGITKALREGRAREMGTLIEEQAVLSQNNKLSGSLAGLGLALGAVQFGNAEGFAEHASAALTMAGSSGDLLQSFSGTMASLQAGGKAANALAKGVPVINAVAGTLGAGTAFKDGDFVGGGLNLAGAGLALAAMAGVPGANVAAAVVAVGAIAWGAWKSHQEAEKMRSELNGLLKDQGVEPGLREFLVESDAGTYKDVKKELKLSDEQLKELVAGDSQLRNTLEVLAKSPLQRDYWEQQAKAAGMALPAYLLSRR